MADAAAGGLTFHEPRYLDAAEVERLLAELSDTFRPVAAVCAYAGLRASEALGLRWEDVDLDAGLLTVARKLDDDGTLREDVKTPGSRATVPILPVLIRELRAHRSRQAENDLRFVHRSALVFSTVRGKPQSRRNALRALHRAGDTAGLNRPGEEQVGLHDLRHSLVGLALDAGLTLAEVAVLARHANARVTGQVYAGLSESGRQGIADKLLGAGIGR